MTLFEKNELRNKAESILESTGIYADGTINFILYKTVKGKNKLIIGFEDLDLNQLVILTNNKILDGDCIRIGKKYQEIFDECIEGFILENLDKGYKPVYISLNLQAHLWDFLDYFINETDGFLKGTYNYMNFCLQTGINQKVLENNSDLSITDLISVFFYENYWEYKILCNFISGTSRLALGYKKTKDNELIYVVIHFEFSPFSDNTVIWKENFISKEKAIDFIKEKLVKFNSHNKKGEEELYERLLTESEEVDDE